MGEKKVRERINHSYAPVRVASGTNRNHMRLDNIPNQTLASRTGSRQTFFSRSHHITLCTLTSDPNRKGQVEGTNGSSPACDCHVIINIIITTVQVTFTSCMRQLSVRHSVCMCVIGILDRIDVCAYTLIKAVPLSTL